MNALLRRFVELAEVDLAAAGFVRRGPVFRYFAPNGDGIALDIQRTAAVPGQVQFFVNVGLLLGPHLRFLFDDGHSEPRLDAMPHDGVWWDRLDPPDGYSFLLSTEADADRAAAVVRRWLAENLGRLKSWLGDYDAMLAAADAGHSWNRGVVEVYAHAERGDVEAVAKLTAGWDDDGPDSLAADALAVAARRRAEREG